MVPNTRTIDPVFQVCGAPAFIEYAMTPDALNKLLYSSFKEPTAKCALTAGHGVICTGLTLRDAFAVFETLDFCARLILRAQRVAIPASLTEVCLYYYGALSQTAHFCIKEQLAYHQFRSSVMAYEEDVFAFRSISSLEKRLRLEMVTCVKKGIQQSLMSATSGSISARLSSNSILITPTGVDRGEMDLQDILLVREDPITNAFTLVHWYQERSALVPSRAIRSHFSIYNRHPQVQGIISAHPLNVSALCAIQSGLETRVMPPPYARLCRVLPVDYGSVLDSDIMAQAFDQTEQDRPSSVLIANDGAITVGESVSGALERLELLESVCSIAIDAHSLGLTAYSMFLPAASRRKEE